MGIFSNQLQDEAGIIAVKMQKLIIAMCVVDLALIGFTIAWFINYETNIAFVVHLPLDVIVLILAFVACYKRNVAGVTTVAVMKLILLLYKIGVCGHIFFTIFVSCIDDQCSYNWIRVTTVSICIFSVLLDLWLDVLAFSLRIRLTSPVIYSAIPTLTFDSSSNLSQEYTFYSTNSTITLR